MKKTLLVSGLLMGLMVLLLFMVSCANPKATSSGQAGSKDGQQQQENKEKVEYPNGPIRIIVTKSVGGSVDAAIRVMQPYLEKELGVPVAIENITSGGGRVASEQVLKATADGNTLLVAPLPSAIVGELMYDGKVDFQQMTPIFNIMQTYQTITVSGKSKVNSFQELLELSKTKKLTMAGSGGMGSNASIVYSKLKMLGMNDLSMVPFPGASEAAAAVIGGHTDISSGSSSGAEKFVQDKTLKILAICAPESLPNLQDVPTMVELGYPDFIVPLTSSVFGPPGMDQKVVDTLEQAFIKVANDQEVQAAAKKMSVDLSPLDSKGLGELVADNTKLVNEILPLLKEIQETK